jgi:hypothetical protein
VKEQLLWLRRFGTVAELDAALREFRDRFNQQWTSGGSATERLPSTGANSSWRPREYPHQPVSEAGSATDPTNTVPQAAAS